AATEVQQQPRQVQRPAVVILLDRRLSAGTDGLDARRATGEVDGGVVLPLRRAVGRGGGARVRPRGARRRIVAQRDVDHVGERELRDPLREIGRQVRRQRRARGARGGYLAGGRPEGVRRRRR